MRFYRFVQNERTSKYTPVSVAKASISSGYLTRKFDFVAGTNSEY